MDKSQPSLSGQLKGKRKSLSTDMSQNQGLNKAYKVKHNNSKKRSSSKNKNKSKPKRTYHLSSYADSLK
jgi:hypothetical protein